MPQPLDRYNPAAERGLLASLQQTPDLAWSLIGRLRPDMFTEGREQQYNVLLAAAQTGQRPMPQITDDEPAADPLAAADTIINCAVARVLTASLRTLAQQVDRLADGTVSRADVLARFADTIEQAQNLQTASAAGLVPAADLLAAVVADVQRRVEHRAATGSSIMGLPTGFRRLDEILNGLEPGLIVLAGRPGMGKTTLANLIAANVAASGVPALYVTYENDRQNLILKHLCRMAGVSETQVRRGLADPVVFGVMAQKFAERAGALYYTEASAETTIDTIKAQALQIKRRHNAEQVLVVVDYLQKMAHTGGFDDLRANVGAITARLRDLSRALSSPVLSLASLSRKGYANEETEPELSDLKESGDIEYGADIVLMLSKREQQGPQIGAGKPVKIAIKKNRGGESDTNTALVFRPDTGDFKELAPAGMAGMNGHR